MKWNESRFTNIEAKSAPWRWITSKVDRGAVMLIETCAEITQVNSKTQKRRRGRDHDNSTLCPCPCHTHINTQLHRWINKSLKVAQCGEWGHRWSVLQPLDKQGRQSAFQLERCTTSHNRRTHTGKTLRLRALFFSPAGVEWVMAHIWTFQSQ